MLSPSLGSASTLLNVEGASCASCVSRIERALQSVQGVDSAEMNLAQQTVTIVGDASESKLIAAIRGVGYDASDMKGKSEGAILDEKDQADLAYHRKLIRESLIALGLGVPLMIYGLFIGEMTVSTNTERAAWLIVGILTFAVMATSGRRFYKGGWKSIRSHTANMDTLIMLGTGAAWIYSMIVVLFPSLLPTMARHVYFEATAMIIGLINLGLALEIKARGRTSEAIKRLIGLQAKTALVVRDGKEIDIAIEDVRLDDILKIRPGEKIPVDGQVIEGNTTIDESMLTGEPMPVEKHEGDSVATGTLNKAGSILFRATRVGKDTALAQIISMVKQAQNSKPPIGRLADVVSGYFVPTIMIIAVASGLYWLNFGPPPAVAFAVVSATTVLIIACPCALGLATPMSVMVGIGKAAEAGVLIRSGEALQNASKITVMVLDKTGTITVGKPEITDLILAGTQNEEEVLRLAASLESGSEHPLAVAIAESAKEQGIEGNTASNFNAVPGHGVEGDVDGIHLLFGNERLMQSKNISIAAHLEHVQSLASQAKTPMFIAADGKLMGIIAVSDPIKEDSIEAIQRLNKKGIRVVMLTGDNRATAAAVAKKVGISEFFAEVLPQDKTQKISPENPPKKILIFRSRKG